MAAASQYIMGAEAGRHCRLRLQACFFFFRVGTREDANGALGGRGGGGGGDVNTSSVAVMKLVIRAVKNL